MQHRSQTITKVLDMVDIKSIVYRLLEESSSCPVCLEVLDREVSPDTLRTLAHSNEIGLSTKLSGTYRVHADMERRFC